MSEVAAISASPQALLYGGRCDVPMEVAVCPECGGQLHAHSTAWITRTGQPIVDGLVVSCTRDIDADDLGEKGPAMDSIDHRWMQDTWIGPRGRVATWAEAMY